MPPKKSRKKKKLSVFWKYFLVSFLLISFSLFYWRSTAIAPKSEIDYVSSDKASDVPLIAATPEIKKSYSFIVGGDMMFDRGVDYHYRGDNIFQSVVGLGDLFKGYDLSLVNLEGPISATPIPADSSGSMSFNFPPKTPDVLVSLGVNAVNLANNHNHNAGASGVANTKKVLLENNITPIGDEVATNSDSVKEFISESGKIAVITINCLESDTNIDSMIGYEKSQGFHVLVFPHWGVEYQKVHTKSQQILAHEWIDSGADIVIGSHPHVVEDAERYKNKPIFYSLGNLLFDQTFSEETQRGLVVSGQFSDSSLKLTLIPIVSHNIKPVPEVGLKRDQIISDLTKNLGGNLGF